MRILIISDTHGRTNTIQDVLEKVGEIDMLIHLGDICGDEDFIYEHCSCPVHMVAGNNDWASSLPMEDEFMIDRYKVFYYAWTPLWRPLWNRPAAGTGEI